MPWATPSTNTMGTTRWSHTQTFTPVEGQADYLFIGVSDADTTAANALVTWGPIVLIPDTDYLVLADRLRLVSTPSAGDVTSGNIITVRVGRI